MITAAPSTFYWPVAIVFTSLSVGSLLRLWSLRNKDSGLRRKRLASLRTWWILAAALSLAVLGGHIGMVLLFTAASLTGWWEFSRLYSSRSEDRTAIQAGYVLILINYGLIAFDFVGLFPVFLPLAAPVVFAFLLLIRDQPQGYIRSTGALLWAMLFLGYGVSHAAYILLRPEMQAGPLGPVGWVLFLLAMTECDDIFQAIIGRGFSRVRSHPIAPVVSPKKTVEGFIGGMVVIVLLAPLLAPWLTTLGSGSGGFVPNSAQSLFEPMLVALLISLAGYYGDINMSAIKRDVGVKDSSHLLPGMGGVIDRIDSLTMTAPVFVYAVIWWLQ